MGEPRSIKGNSTVDEANREASGRYLSARPVLAPEVIRNLERMKEILAPIMNATLEEMEGLELKPLMAQALHRGNELHNREAAATSLFLKRILSALFRIDASSSDLSRVADFIASNDHFFLNISMAARKLMVGKTMSSVPLTLVQNWTPFRVIAATRLLACTPWAASNR